MSVVTVPFSEQHPFHAQLMHVERIPFPLPGFVEMEAPSGYSTMGWGFRKWPRAEDRVELSGGASRRLRHACDLDRLRAHRS